MTDTNETAPVEVIDPWATPEADAIRVERDERLAASDWAVLPDAPAQRSMLSRVAVWTYRKALRDITEDFASPADVVWPDFPDEIV